MPGFHRRQFLAGSLALGAAASSALPALGAVAPAPPAFTALSRLKDAHVPTRECFAPAGARPVAGPGSIRLSCTGQTQTIPLSWLRGGNLVGGNYVYELPENGSAISGGCDEVYGLIHAADWQGVPLSSLLPDLDPHGDAAVAISGVDGTVQLPAAKAMRDAMLAVRMNGEAIDPWHGGPVRLVVPGWEGALWVRGVSSVTLLRSSAADSSAPARTTDDLHPSRAARQPQVLGVKSVITAPAPRRPLKGYAGATLAGFAWTGRGRVERVEVTLDGGETWQDAQVTAAANTGALQRFTLPVTLTGRQMLVASRATDTTGAVQLMAASPLLAAALPLRRHVNAIRFWHVAPDGRVLA